MKVGRCADMLQGYLGILGPFCSRSLGLGLDADFYRLFICKWALNCCSIWFLIHEEKEETHPKMLYSNKIFKAFNKIFCTFGVSMATLSAELLLRKEAGCFNEPTGSVRQPAHICLLVSWLPGVDTLKQIDGAGVRLSRLCKILLLLWQFFVKGHSSDILKSVHLCGSALQRIDRIVFFTVGKVRNRNWIKVRNQSQTLNLLALYHTTATTMNV